MPEELAAGPSVSLLIGFGIFLFDAVVIAILAGLALGVHGSSLESWSQGLKMAVGVVAAVLKVTLLLGSLYIAIAKFWMSPLWIGLGAVLGLMTFALLTQAFGNRIVRSLQ